MESEYLFDLSRNIKTYNTLNEVERFLRANNIRSTQKYRDRLLVQYEFPNRSASVVIMENNQGKLTVNYKISNIELERLEKRAKHYGYAPSPICFSEAAKYESHFNIQSVNKYDSAQNTILIGKENNSDDYNSVVFL